MKKQFNDGDEIKYVKEAPEWLGMKITVNEFIGTYRKGLVSNKDWEFPLVGLSDISDCFEKVN